MLGTTAAPATTGERAQDAPPVADSEPPAAAQPVADAQPAIAPAPQASQQPPAAEASVPEPQPAAAAAPAPPSAVASAEQPADPPTTEPAAEPAAAAAAPPAPAVPAAAPAPPADEPKSFEQRFIEEAGEAARETMRRTGVPASVTVAQAILESDWGRSGLAKQGKNYFGIKAQGGAAGSAGVVWMPTKEFSDGKWITIEAPFRAYASAVDSFVDHANFLLGPRYRAALEVNHDPDEYARRIHKAGYATDPGYADKLIRLMQRWDLYRFDQ